MAKTNPKASFLIDDYITNLPTFSKEICTVIRELIHKTKHPFFEDWKWNRPIFTTQKIICVFSAHKNHVSLTFFDGANMSYNHQLFKGDIISQNKRVIKY
jgi:hypothetical protein